MLYVALLLGSLRRALRPDRPCSSRTSPCGSSAVYQRRGARPRLRAGIDASGRCSRGRGPTAVRRCCSSSPETVIRWHRTVWRRYWTWKSRKRLPGRLRIDPAPRQLIHQLAP